MLGAAFMPAGEAETGVRAAAGGRAEGLSLGMELQYRQAPKKQRTQREVKVRRDKCVAD